MRATSNDYDYVERIITLNFKENLAPYIELTNQTHIQYYDHTFTTEPIIDEAGDDITDYKLYWDGIEEGFPDYLTVVENADMTFTFTNDPTLVVDSDVGDHEIKFFTED